MQPENQPGAPLPPAPQAPQPVQPAQPQPLNQVPQAGVPQQAPQYAQPVAQPQYQPTPAPQPQPIQPQQPVVAPQPTVETVPQQPVPTAPEALGSAAVADQVQDGYGFEAGDEEEYDEGEIDLSQPIQWRAKEYIHQEKGTMWFVAFAAVLVVFMAIAIFLMHSWSFAILLVVIAAVIVVFAKRPPREMEYALSEDGLHIDNTLHAYDDFKSFGVIRDGEEFSVMLIPRRRFQPGITVYFPEEAGEDIVDVLGSRLPMKDLNLDAVDKLVRKLRL